MAVQSTVVTSRNGKRKTNGRKKTRQGNGINSKFATHKRSKLYKKKYRGQGRSR